jgi:hypothetical protein
MTALRDGDGGAVNLGEEIGRGGEAVIRAVADRPDQVAKLWHDPAAHDRAAKLRAMLTAPPADPTAASGHVSIPWPSTAVFDGADTLRGFLMPRLGEAKPLFEVFNPARRRAVAPGWDERYLYRAARNLASVLETIHRAGYVVGDLNESNVLVAPTALVSVVDTDSFQVRAIVDGAEVVYPCRVGKPEYVAPELQGQPLATTRRTPAMDRFALAVLIFQLLNDGNHPYRARWTGPGEPPSLEQSISRNLYPHDGAPSAPVAPPPGMPPVAALHPGLQALFRRAFVDGHADPERRPNGSEWAAALAAAEGGLVRCPNGHWHDRRNATCPECAAVAAAERARARSTPRAAAERLDDIGNGVTTGGPPSSTAGRRASAAGGGAGQASAATPPHSPPSPPPRWRQRPQPGPGAYAPNPLVILLARGLGRAWRAMRGPMRPPPSPPPGRSRRQTGGPLPGPLWAWLVVCVALVVLFGRDEPGQEPTRRAADPPTVAVDIVEIRPPEDPWEGEYGPAVFVESFSETTSALPVDGRGRATARDGSLVLDGGGSDAATLATIALDPMAAGDDIAVDASFPAVAGGEAVLGLEDERGRRLLLVVDPAARTWRLGRSRADAESQMSWRNGDAPAALPSGRRAEPNEARLELRRIDGRVFPLFDGVPLGLAGSLEFDRPTSVLVGVRPSTAAGPAPNATVDYVRVRRFSAGAPAVFATDFADPAAPRVVRYHQPGLSVTDGGGRLLVVDDNPDEWPVYRVGPEVAADPVVVEAAIADVEGGAAVLSLRAGEAVLTLFVWPADRSWSVEQRVGDAITGAAGRQRLADDLPPPTTFGFRTDDGLATVLLDGQPVWTPGQRSLHLADPFVVSLGVLSDDTQRATAEFGALRIAHAAGPAPRPSATAPSGTPRASPVTDQR